MLRLQPELTLRLEGLGGDQDEADCSGNSGSGAWPKDTVLDNLLNIYLSKEVNQRGEYHSC